MPAHSTRHIEVLLPAATTSTTDSLTSTGVASFSISPDATSESQTGSTSGSPNLRTDATAETTTSTATDTSSITDTGFTGETNVLINEGTNTPSILDFIISNQEPVVNQGTATLTLVEAIAETLRNGGTGTQTDGNQYDTTTSSGENIPSITDIVNGSVSETLTAGDGAGENPSDTGYTLSCVNIPSILETSNFALTDVTPPTLQAAYFLGNTVTLVYSEEIDPFSIPATSAFVVKLNGVSLSILSVTSTLNQVYLNVTGMDLLEPDYTNAVCATYTVPGSDPIQDLVGNDASSFDLCDSIFVPGEEGGDPPIIIGTPPPPIGNGDNGSGGGSGRSFGAAGISLHGVRFRPAQRPTTLAGTGGAAGASTGGGGADWHPGTPPAQWKSAIAAAAEGLSDPTHGNPIKISFGLANCTPSSLGTQYFASVAHNDEVTFHDGHHWIWCKYRNPPLNGNTIEVRID